MYSTYKSCLNSCTTETSTLIDMRTTQLLLQQPVNDTVLLTHFKMHSILNIKQEHIRLLIPYRCVLSSVNFPPYSSALGSQKVNIYRKI